MQRHDVAQMPHAQTCLSCGGFFGTKNTSGPPFVKELNATSDGSQSTTARRLRHDAWHRVFTGVPPEVSRRRTMPPADSTCGSRGGENFHQGRDASPDPQDSSQGRAKRINTRRYAGASSDQPRVRHRCPSSACNKMLSTCDGSTESRGIHGG